MTRLGDVRAAAAHKHEFSQGSRSASAVVIALLSAIAFSTKAIFAKLAYVHKADATTILALRMLFALPFFAAALWWKTRHGAPRLTRRDHLKIWALGVVGFYLSAVFDFFGLYYITASLERVVLYTYPTMVVLLSWALLGRAPSGAQAIALVVTYVGLAISFAAELAVTQNDALRGTALVLTCALTYSIYLIGSRALIMRFGSLFYTSYALLVATAVMTVHALMINWRACLEQPPIVYGIAAAMAIIATVIPLFLLGHALGRLDSSTVAIVSSIGPVATIGMAIVLLGETPTIQQLVGGAIVIAGVVWIGAKTPPVMTTTGSRPTGDGAG